MRVESNSAEAAPGEKTLRIRIVDELSTPVPGVVPVASEGPSMLSEMVAEGAPSDADGMSTLNYPEDKWIYVRGADASGKFVADRYAEVPPGEANVLEEPVELKMTAPATVSATLHDANGAPVTGDSAALVVIHPAHGPWWRAESDIDASGGVVFSGLPVGVYALIMQLGGADAVTIREVVLAAGETKDLGVVTPQSGE